MPTVIRHMRVNIQGMLKFYKRKKMNGILEDNGRKLSDPEARQYLAECLAKGWKYIPTGDCEGFDHFEGGCPGHEKKEVK